MASRPKLSSVRCRLFCFLAFISSAILRDYHFQELWYCANTLGILSKRIRSNPDQRIILSWTKFFGAPLGDKYLDRCPDLRQICRITTNRKEYAEADAIVFHPFDMDWDTVPPARWADQRYLFLLHESPANMKFDWDRKPNFFNWSFTYRLDSDVPFPYEYVGLSPSAARPLDTEVILNKDIGNASIVWFASHCETPSRREEYVRELEKLIPIDIYGDCGPLKCPKVIERGLIQRSKCEDIIETNFKFYIAFENSVCTDYVTEKYFFRFNLYSIPLVLSRRIAQPLFPPKSFIAIDDFPEGPRQLAAYLQYLNGNDSAYLEYFHWKTVGYALVNKDPRNGMRFGFCGLCERVWREEEEGYARKVIESVEEWWGEKAVCDSGLVSRLLAKQ